MSRKMTRVRRNAFVDYKGFTRHLSAERSEASQQFFVSSWKKSNCSDPSLRSG
jgi:hypothetical protein